MKKTLALLLAILLMLSLAACSVKIGDLSERDDIRAEHDGTGESPELHEGETQLPEQNDPTSSEIPKTVPTKDGAGSARVMPMPQAGTEGVPAAAWETPESLWERLGGCWVDESGDHFAYFTYTDDGPAFWSGKWENPIPYRRQAAAVTGLTAFEGGIFTLSVTYPPIEEDAADAQDLRPLLYTMTLDISGLDEGVLRVEAPEDQWREYVWGGVSYDDAYDASYSGTPYATFAEMQSLWTELGGYWSSDDGRFLYFDQMDSNTLLFGNGIQNAGWGQGLGTFEKAMTSIGEIPLRFIVYYAPIENELDGTLPARHQSVYLDIMDLYTKNTLYARLDEKGEWTAYIYVGDTLEG